ncbi:MAG: glycoside hydrolase family 18 protein, partial [Acidobacteriaceae bacterium]|nr:glycoside hydrolase family 18 protein [Acidobacteriaceae bacterium]
MKKLVFCILLGIVPACSAAWRTGYYFQPGSSTLPISAIPFSKYTHIIHYGTEPTNNCGIDATSYSISANAAAFISAAHANGVKALVSMVDNTGGSIMNNCTTSSTISGFVSTIANFVNSYGYDGFDLDWEGSINNSQYQQFIGALRRAMPDKVLTVASGWNQRYVLAQVQADIDQINCGTYDADTGTVAGQWRTDTAYNSALYQGSNTDWITADAIYYYMVRDAGIASTKIGIGMPFYARIKQGCMAGYLSGSTCSRDVSDPGQRYASGDATTNPRTAINYNQLISSAYWTSGTRVWDATHGAQYIRYEPGNPVQNAFIPYTGVEQMQEAVRYILAANLGGIMTYDLSGEYLSNQTGDARYPLSTAIYQAMTSGSTGGGTPPPPPPQAPLSGQVTPSSGAGRGATFTVHAVDTTGATVTQIAFLVNTSGVVKSCYVQYSPSTNIVYLANDAASGWSEASIGSSVALHNSQCHIDVHSATVSGSAGDLTVTLPVQFTAGFAGAKNLYTFIADSSGATTGWQAGGS